MCLAGSAVAAALALTSSCFTVGPQKRPFFRPPSVVYLSNRSFQGRTVQGKELGLSQAALTTYADTTNCELPRVQRDQTNSTFCLSCHDGSAGEGIGESHPVEMPYPSGLPDYNPLPMQLLLVNGNVACTTCHDASSGVKPWLAVPAEGLCQACHNK